MRLETVKLNTDILIIGGGTAGCFAALTVAEQKAANVLIVEKANIKRSGCLAAGVNALNAYIVEGQTPEDYVDYVRNDAEAIIREDLVATMAAELNQVTKTMEDLGLVIQKDSQGNYVTRGNRNIKINGENIKPLLATAVEQAEHVRVLNRVNITDYIVSDGRIVGAYGFSLDRPIFYVILAKAVICATGGAAGLYRPNNPGFSRHKMWYSPFNTGAGYAMGIRAGAEMTTFEMRFIALRCKDTIAPTGTIAQGIGAEQINSRGELYEKKYGKPKTSIRLYSTVQENQRGAGPCYLNTVGITEKQEDDLYKAYLNMAPAQTLRWLERGLGPAKENVEIEGTEPYIVGGHTGSGYWVDSNRATTLRGLYAAGDVAGGSPQKYVTGCFVEGKIAAQAAMQYLKQAAVTSVVDLEQIELAAEAMNRFLADQHSVYQSEDIEEAMQKIMDDYAGGISSGYMFNTAKLQQAKIHIDELRKLSLELRADSMIELLAIYEVIDRLEVCRVLIHHLEARKETRWHSFQENADYPEKDDEHWLKFVNSVVQEGQVKIILRDLVKKGEVYEHNN